MGTLTIVAGTLLLLLGVISMVTPIPGGTLAIATGAGLIICSSERAAAKVKEWRSKHSRFNQTVTWIENKIGDRLSRPLRLTRPDSDASTAQASQSEQDLSE